MGFDIPEPFVWDESFRVDYDNLDTQHQNLFKCIFDVAGAPADGGKLAKLVDTCANHFKTEEDMFAKAGYADAGPHKKAHDEFLGKIKGLGAPVDGGTVNFAKDWLVNHIKGVDHKYKGKL